jgi:hypothetical protein
MLEALDVASGIARIDDSAISELSSIPRLRQLFIGGKLITDRGLLQLTAAKQLRELYLFDTTVSEDAVTRLKAAIPGISIERIVPPE